MKARKSEWEYLIKAAKAGILSRANPDREKPCERALSMICMIYKSSLLVECIEIPKDDIPAALGRLGVGLDKK